MPGFPFAGWFPDQPDLGNPGVVKATNVFPSASGYLPVKSFVARTDALDARPRGAVRARDTSGTAFEYAGDAAKLYHNNSNSWDDVSKSGGYSTGGSERWEFVPWKNKMLATNWNDSPQQITFGDANFSDLTTAFKSRHITTIRDFVVHANTFDGTDGNVPSRVRWSAFNDETDYTVSASTLSDFQDLKTAANERIFGGEFGVIFQPQSVWRMTFVGAPVVFQFDEVFPGTGLIASGAAARDGDIVYFLSPKGFFALVNGTQATAIGADKVDRFVLEDLDVNHLSRISAVADPGSQRVFWAYPGAGNLDGRPNKIAVFDKSTGKWSIIELETELIWRSGGVATDIDDLTGSIDDIETSLDSRVFAGAGTELGVFDDSFKHGFLSGSENMTAIIETKEFELNAGRRTRLNAFSPLVDGGTVTARIGKRDRQADTVSYTESLDLSDSGRFTKRANASYHRFEFTLTGDWSHAIGMQIERRWATPGERRR